MHGKKDSYQRYATILKVVCFFKIN